MKKGFDSRPLFRLALAAFCLLQLASCRSRQEISANDQRAHYAIPEAKAFTLPEAHIIPWRYYPKDSLPRKTVFRFDINKLPSQPFSVNEFRPLKKPLQTISFEWNKLRTIPVLWDSLKYEPAAYKEFRLPAPEIITTPGPSLWGKGLAGATRLGPPEGLPGSKVLAIANDADGSTWIATERGLARYTGTEIYSYNFFDKDDTGGTEVLAQLKTDAAGRLLLSALKSGIYRIDLKTGIVERIAIPGIGRFDIDHKGRLWGARNGGGLFLVDIDNRRTARLPLGQGQKEEKSLYGVHVDSSGYIWLAFGDKVGIIDTVFSAMRVLDAAAGLPVNLAYDFDEDVLGNHWISSFSAGAYAVSLKDQVISRLGPEQGYSGLTYDVFTDTAGKVWLATNDTVLVYDTRSKRSKIVVTNTSVRVNNFPSAGMIGRDGMIWMGTNSDGVLLLDPNGMMADHFSEKDGLASKDVWGIAEDSKRRIWLATYKGINIYDPALQRLFLFRFPPGVAANEHRQIVPIGPDIFFLGTVGGFAVIDLPAGTITSYNTAWNKINSISFMGFPDSSGNFWFVGGNGLLVYNPRTDSLRQFDENAGLISNLVFITRKDSRGRVWLCTERGTVLIDPLSGTYRTITDANGLTGNYSSMILESSSGDIFIGSDKGFSKLDPGLKTITNVGSANGMLPPGLFDMVEWEGQLFIGTENGITRVGQPFEKKQPWAFYNFAKSSGFPYNDYNQSTALVSSSGETWWGATPVLTIAHQYPRIDTTPPVVLIKGVNIMDQSPSFVNRASLAAGMNDKDSLWIGAAAFTKDKLPADAGYLVENNISWDSLSTGFQLPVGLKLPYDQNSFSFSFANIDPRAREKIAYRYLLEGKDESWSDITGKAFSRVYYNVKPGDYTFKVISRGFNGVWSRPATVGFTILPPWWRTWWAYLLFFLLGTAIIYSIIRIRYRMLQKENRILEKKVEIRTRDLHQKMEELKATQNQLVQSEKMASLGELTAGIAHEIQNPLNFINNFAEINKELLTEMSEELEKGNAAAAKDLAADVISNEEKIFHHGSRADAIVKSMLQHSRNNNNLVKEPADINKIADEYLRLAYHGLRARDKSFNAAMHTDLDPNIPPVTIVVQDIGRAVLNLLTNAFYAVTEKKKENLPGYEPSVTVRTRRSGDMVELQVIDNGNGMPARVLEKIFQPFFTTKPTGQGTGLGLSMCYDIVTKVHGGELKVDSREGEGTTFTMRLPVDKKG